MGDSEVKELVTGQAKIATEVAQLGARFDAHADRTRSEVQALFDSKSGNERRISRIEQQYVPREAFQRFEDKLDEKISTMVKTQDAVKTSVTRIVAIGGVLVVVANMVVSVLVFLAK